MLLSCLPYTVPLGGFLFEYYMLTTSGYVSHRNYVKLLNEVEDGQPFSVPDQEEFIKANSANFVGWLLFQIGQIGTNGRRQLFYVTFLSHYYGLSRNGMVCLARLGYAIGTTIFDDMRSCFVLQAKNTLE
jgi:hypothetical protein